MELHFVATANVFVYYPYWKKANSALTHCGRGSPRRTVDGIYIVQLNYRCTLTLLILKT